MQNNNPKFKIEKINLVCSSKTLLKESICNICKTAINSKCPKCLSNNTNNNDKCTISIGKCGCDFHTHCIEPWLKTSKHCPNVCLGGTFWEEKEQIDLDN